MTRIAECPVCDEEIEYQNVDVEMVASRHRFSCAGKQDPSSNGGKWEAYEIIDGWE